MRAVASALVLLLLAGCQGRVLSPWATPPKVEQAFDAPKPLLEALARRRSRLADLKARTRLTLRTPEQELTVQQALVLKGLNSLRLETLSPMGQPTGILVAKDDHIRWVDPVGGRYWDGPASQEALERLVGVPMVPEEMVAILAGALPAGTEAAHALLEPAPGEGVYRLSMSAAGLTEVVVVDEADLTVRSRVRYDADGRELLRVTYGRFRNLQDYPFPLLVELTLPQRDYHLKVDYQKVLLNQEVDDGLFDLPIPPGSTKVALE
jgi:outer membrane lipoprotein-sorting protein